MSPRFHLWLALSPHGFGHAAMTAPVITRLRQRCPRMRLTIQTTVDKTFLQSRYGNFDHVARIEDFGFRMISATGIDLEASARDYCGLVGRYDQAVADNVQLMAENRPDLVLSNVAFVPLAAAARLGIPSLAMSSLNWADMYRHYLGHRPEAGRVLETLTRAYEGAVAFLRCTPSQQMSLSNLRPIGPIAEIGTPRPQNLRQVFGPGDTRFGLVAFGGIDHDVSMEDWPSLPGWHWLTPQPPENGRPDMDHWTRAGMSFTDLVASVDVVVTKPGYGTFTEAAMVGTPVLFTERPDWPESPHLDNWLKAHTRALETSAASLLDGSLPDLLQRLFSLPAQQVASPDGVDHAVDMVLRTLCDSRQINVCS
ncbi:MAG: hypothetical protein BGO92_08910 [Magnetospirillum sp. 64-120]|nr:MAG: hypothetical protein BGO92_08910 [Magnetospirillum sp. 64-120]